MSYLEVIAKALKGKSVNATAKAWNIQQRTLDRYVKGELLPTYSAAMRIADEAGITYEEMLRTLAEEEEKRRPKIMYNPAHADVAQLVEQLIRNQ
jgi:transcriptional regulator with XRE-family HTH domain